MGARGEALDPLSRAPEMVVAGGHVKGGWLTQSAALALQQGMLEAPLEGLHRILGTHHLSAYPVDEAR
jgi:hypothetical protein